jgi:hypothetical protein
MKKVTAYLEVDAIDGSGILECDAVRAVEALCVNKTFSYHDPSLGREVTVRVTGSAECDFDL